MSSIVYRTFSTKKKNYESSGLLRSFINEQRALSKTIMSTIQDVREAEQKVQEILDALKKAKANDPQNLTQKLMSATDEYAKAVRELK